jgi:hypothetical protein
MTPSEKAWKPVSDHWQVYRAIPAESDAERRLLDVIKELQQMQLPIYAIDLIGLALRCAHQTALEASTCGKCGA